MTNLTNTKVDLDVESMVYPQYDTRGDFGEAVNKFAEWTQLQVKIREVSNIRAYGRRQGDSTDTKVEGTTSEEKIPPVYVCFLGHSMGGLVAADAALLLNALPKKSPVIGILAFDTPYFGLNHTIFTEAAYERVAGLAQKATGAISLMSAYIPAAAAWGAIAPSTADASSDKRASGGQKRELQPAASSAPSSGFNPTSLWSSTSAKVEKEKTTSSSSSKWGWGSIALGVGAAVAATGAVYVVNSHMNKGMEYITSHVQFVGILWNNAELKKRVTTVLNLPIGFHCFYTQVQIPANSSNNKKSTSRTFIELSAIPGEMRERFSARECSGQDEIEAHTEIFNPGKNFDYYQMGDDTIKRLSAMVDEALRRE
ncbi:hypothetical protein BGZ58_003493 [Dissophora ornata]|nr:hypothetical protein BGZ58_003493 [Dissophora ornata]